MTEPEDRRASPHRKTLMTAIASAGLALIAVPITLHPLPRLVWNASASAPIGLYGVSPSGLIAVGDLVVARVPQPWRHLAATRHYLPENVPLVKRVAAGPGDQICALGPSVFINGEAPIERRKVDGAGRSMPWWEGCRRLGRGQHFLLMAGKAASFDGRYFGPSEQSDILGRARLLWAR